MTDLSPAERGVRCAHLAQCTYPKCSCLYVGKDSTAMSEAREPGWYWVSRFGEWEAMRSDGKWVSMPTTKTITRITPDFKIGPRIPVPTDKPSCCPFCGREPFRVLDTGDDRRLGAVCCRLAGELLRGDLTVAPETVTLSWREFVEIATRLTAGAATGPGS